MMVAKVATLTPSFNAGELSPDLKHKAKLKAFYQGGLQYKNIEPVPQGGFQLLPGTRHVASARDIDGPIRFKPVQLSNNEIYLHAVTSGWVDVYKQGTGKVADVEISAISEAMVPELQFYAEAETVGLFHADLETQRLVYQSESVWALSDWPYEAIPNVDYGGTYPKTDDVWDLTINWSGSPVSLIMELSIDGETTEGIEFAIWNGGSPTTGAVDDFATAVQNAIRDLSTFGTGVTVVRTGLDTSAKYIILRITFGGDYSGEAYQITPQITNTSEISVLGSHVEIGKTDGEPLLSTSRGWPGLVGFYQDRMVYAGIKGRKAAMATSRIGEYFDLNIEAGGDAAARLDAIRTLSNEEIRAVVASTYLVIFTDRGEYFVSNREVNRNQPLNFVDSGRNGIPKALVPQEIEAKIYFISSDGNVLYSSDYDEISTKYIAQPDSTLATHLVKNIISIAKQSASDRQDANRLWMLRQDGRLIMGAVLGSEDINVAACEWVVAASGKVKAFEVDASNTPWLAVQRDSGLHIEVMDDDCLFQSAIEGVSDGSGVLSGLDHLEGQIVYIDSDGLIEGPFTVAEGAISTQLPDQSMLAGLWQPPVFESMPRLLLTQDDNIIHRPGRIHTLHLSLEDTQSLAVGANGEETFNVPLAPMDSDFSGEQIAVSEWVTVDGILGVTLDPTYVITQHMPGRLRVLDVRTEESL